MIIKCLKKFGFTLNECQAVLLEMDENPDRETHKRNVATAKLKEIEQQIEELVRIKDTLVNVLEG